MTTDATTMVAPVTPAHPPIHPGEILAEDLDDIGVSQAELARALGVPRSRVSEIIRGVRPITADTALRLSRYFGTSDHYWINMQAHYDVELAKDQHADEFARIAPRRAS
jgi:addiction module HigA family antidote